MDTLNPINDHDLLVKVNTNVKNLAGALTAKEAAP